MADELIEYPEGSNVAIAGGKVMPVGKPPITPSEVLSQLKDVFRMPYMGKDLDKVGMSLIEAALYSAMKAAADGDTDALEKMLNRIMGRPLQSVQNLNVNGTLKELLDGIARSDTITVEGTDPFSG